MGEDSAVPGRLHTGCRSDAERQPWIELERQPGTDCYAARFFFPRDAGAFALVFLPAPRADAEAFALRPPDAPARLLRSRSMRSTTSADCGSSVMESFGARPFIFARITFIRFSR